MHRQVASVLISLAGLFLLAAPLRAATSPVQLGSTTGDPSASGLGASFNPTFSADSRSLVFVSQAENLATNSGAPGSTPLLRVYVYSIANGNLRLASLPASGNLSASEDATLPSLATNAAWVVFESRATNLVAGDSNGVSDVFLRDLDAGTTRRLSEARSGGASSGSAGRAVLAANGRRVIFESSATDLTTNFFPFLQAGLYLYARDLPDGPTVLITTDTGGAIPARAPGPSGPRSESGGVSADGRWATFFSTATNLVTGQTGVQGEVYVRDFEAGTTVCASLEAGTILTGQPTACRSFSPVLSDSGSMLVFQAQLTGLSSNPPPALLAFPLPAGPISLVATQTTFRVPAISANGRFTAYEDSDGLWLADLQSGTRESVSAPPAQAAALSADGNRLVYLAATNPAGPWRLQLYERTNGLRRTLAFDTNGAPAEVSALSEPAISPDGQWIAFESESPALIPGDRNGQTDIFLVQVETGALQLVSRVASGAPPTVGAAPSGSVSGRGGASQFARHVAFTSHDPSLDSAFVGPGPKVFIRDRLTGQTQLLRRPAGNGPTPASLASSPVLGRDGRHAAWHEFPAADPSAAGLGATNLVWLDLATGASWSAPVAGAAFMGRGPALSLDGWSVAFSAPLSPGGWTQILRRDLSDPNATNEWISVTLAGQPGAGESTNATFSADGRWILFSSTAANLAPETVGVPLTGPQLYARDLVKRQTRLISLPALPLTGTPPALSADSRHAFYEARSITSGFTSIYRRDLLTTNAPTLICSNCGTPSPNGDGSKVAYETPDNQGRIQIYVRDLWSGLVYVASSNTTTRAVGNRPSRSPQLSADGRFTLFVSHATNLANDDTNGVQDVFVHDRSLGTVTLLSRGPDGTPGRGASMLPALSPDGRTAVFTSFAPNLAAGDVNHARDVHVVRLDGEDRDNDGLEDGWELAYLNTLAESGDDDHDGDGASNRMEYEAVTHPADGESVLKLLPASYARDNVRILVWNSVPGRRYRVQYRRTADEGPWIDRPPTMTASGTTTTAFDNVPDPTEHRFYRIVQEP